ncbi:DEAD/DEAH box helicase [Streptomyces prasinopilosus]|uniref:DEAD/DEAH box helicase n=1 Tax=Streptomyces prasinopilosus TaxID=67344 RepID=UPI001FD3E2F0|nr:DEAD/DEAH box helicase [Streptomyces prasinopilosus]
MGSTAAAGPRVGAVPTGQGTGSPGADPWHEALRGVVGSAVDDPAVAGEAVRRLRAGLLTVRDMRLVLLGAVRLPGWRPVRRAVIDVLADDAEQARHVLVTHTQVEVLPPPRYAEVPPEHGGTGAAFAAVVGPVGEQVTGPARRARTGRGAKDRAALALLAGLAGVEPPDREPDGGGAAGRPVLPGMLTEVFEHRLLRALSAGRGPGPELAEEALRRAGSGRLRHRDLYLLLLAARGEEWTEVRTAALRRAAAMPPAPARLLHWYAAQQGAGDGGGEGHGLFYEEQAADGAGGRHRVRARLRAERTWTGPERAARSRGTAKHYACCALLAELAGLPEPAPQVEDGRAEAVRITVPAQGQDPVKTLNKHYQREAITRPESTLRVLGPRVECTYRCRHRDSDLRVQATAVGPDKNAARGAAALKLLRKLASVDAAEGAGTVGGAAAPGALGDPDVLGSARHGAEGSRSAGAGSVATPVAPSPIRLREAVAAGRAVSFVPARGAGPAAWWVRDGGSRSRVLPGTGRYVPLAEGLPAVHRAGEGADPTALFWQRAVHIALQLVRARLVRPALDERGYAVWRVSPVPVEAEGALTALAAAAPPGAVLPGAVVPGDAPSDPGAAARQALLACCDAVADALVRTPAAVLCGTGPWTASAPGPVAPGARDAVGGWLDDVEDLVDNGPAPRLILRIRPPDDEQAAAGRLTADLHLAPADTASAGPLPDGPDGPGEVAAARVWSGAARVGGEGADTVRPRVRRVLRRAARLHPDLDPLASMAGEGHPRQCVLHSRAIVALLEREAGLAAAGVRVVWPERLRTALSAAAVVGTPDGEEEAGPVRTTGSAGSARSAGPAGERSRFGVTALLDFRWQVALDGSDLSEEEMDALAEAARPLVRIRGEWVLADPVLRRRARHRLLGRLPGTQALTAALSGTVAVDGDTVACRPAGPLADMIGVLRQGEHHPEAVPAPAGLTAALRGYQHRALTWLAHTTRLGFGALLADDMGLGKTLTTLAFALHHQRRGSGPTLVVCPASLVATWCREAARFAPRLPVVAYHGADRTLEAVTATTLVVTTYDLLRRDPGHLAERHWGLVVADEAQHAKNPASTTARRLRALPSTTRLALTGTPVENNLSELWALLDWTNPGLFGPLTAFRSRWANAAEKNPDGVEAAALGRVVAPFLLRRRKTDPGIAPDLPAKIDRPCPVRLTTEQAGLYEAVVRETLRQIRDARGIERNGLVFRLLTALKQITNHPAHYLREQPPAGGESAAFTARSAKTAALVDLLETIRAREEAVLVFTGYVAMGRLLTALLTHLGHDPLFLHGATPLAERTRGVDAFQAGRHPVLVLSLKAAGTGLTLTRAAHVVHYDRSWNAAVEDQATDRAHRIGQHRTVTVHRLITRHTVEDRIDELLTRKRALASAVLTGGDRALTRLTDRELADLVALGEPR